MDLITALVETSTDWVDDVISSLLEFVETGLVRDMSGLTNHGGFGLRHYPLT